MNNRTIPLKALKESTARAAANRREEASEEGVLSEEESEALDRATLRFVKGNTRGRVRKIGIGGAVET